MAALTTAEARTEAESGLATRILRAIFENLNGLSGGNAGSGLSVTPGIAGYTARASGNFTRPADTTAYASGDLVANSTTAASVAPITITAARSTGLGGMVRRVSLLKSTTSTTNASFRVHFYSATPGTPNAGDNGAWLTPDKDIYLGSCDVTMDKAFSDGACGVGAPGAGSEINFTSDNLYCLIEARAAYTPGNAEVFTLVCELLQN